MYETDKMQIHFKIYHFLLLKTVLKKKIFHYNFSRMIKWFKSVANIFVREQLNIKNTITFEFLENFMTISILHNIWEYFHQLVRLKKNVFNFKFKNLTLNYILNDFLYLTKNLYSLLGSRFCKI